ncbi:hypothetical protein ACFYQ5_20075 [Streptomyces sp. NPDC005794]|uniref:effector-associated constant component EACC1 n=1 Tax=Streptomyces sp. NPDC005794 TaxID=3364733 RepID=UPI0036978B02
MRVVIRVEGGDSGGLLELRRLLSEEPELRGRVRGQLREPLPPDAMGLGADALIAMLAPGGVAAVFAGAVVAWVQSRRGDQTVTVIRPDGTEITISSTRVRGLDAQQNAQLARELAAALGGVAETPAPSQADGRTVASTDGRPPTPLLP